MPFFFVSHEEYCRSGCGIGARAHAALCCVHCCAVLVAADVGIGIVGKEGMQASLSADFSITQFSHVAPLFLWHGRNAYKRSARLSQFVIHRGLIISIIQAVFSALFFFTTVPIYSGWLMVPGHCLHTPFIELHLGPQPGPAA